MPSVSANNITIEYEQRGSGPHLVAIMGLGGQLTDWSDGFLDLLSQHFTVTVFDNRDAGLSSEMGGDPLTKRQFAKSQLTRTKPPSEYLLEDMAADTNGLLEQLDIAKAHVIGISMGGMIAQSLAINHAAKVLSLTSIMSKPGDPKSGGIDKKLLLKIARRQDVTREGAVEASLATFAAIGGSSWDREAHRIRAERSVARSFRPEGQLRQTAAIAASPNRTRGLRELRIPALVIHGLQDPLVRPSGGIATAKAVPGSRLLMFPDMGHDLPENRWPEITEAIEVNTRRAALVS